MIIYSRFNCRHFCIEKNASPQIHPSDIGRAVRRMNKLRFEEQWLRERLELFKLFTLPSVENQTNQKFRWVGIAHPNSPTWFIDELAAVSRMELQLHEWDVAADEGGHTTVNLDTDDALARNFVAEARKIKFEGETIFPRGMRYRPRTDCWVGTWSANAHFNVVQHPELTVLDFSHGMYDQIEKQIIEVRHPMWLEVIHERNISNRIRTARATQNLGANHAKHYFDVDYEAICRSK
jgi:hypothetical protein